MIVHDVYIDESDTHEGTEAIYLAAVVGTQSHWEKFDRRWGKMLRQKRVEIAHACDIRGKWGRFGQYAHWDEDDVFDFLTRADRLLQNNTLFTVVIRLDRETFKQHYQSEPVPTKKTKLDTDYALCFRAVLSFVPEYLALMHGTPDVEVNFILEEHQRFGDAHRVFLDIKDNIPEIARYLGTCIPGAKKKFVGLQGADFQAYKVAFNNPQPDPVPVPEFPPIESTSPKFERRAFERLHRDIATAPQAWPTQAPIFIAHADEVMLRQLRHGMLGYAEMKKRLYQERKSEWEASQIAKISSAPEAE